MTADVFCGRPGAVLNGIKVYSFSGFDDIIDAAVSTRSIMVACNSDKLYYSQQRLKDIINANIGYCDGVGAVWALERKGVKGAVKIAGCDLWLEIIKRYPGAKYYLVGAEQQVIDEVVKKLHVEYPEMDIVGFRNGFFKSDQEKDVLVKDICEKRPDFVFVAMGSPKQEYMLDDIHSVYPVPMMGLGGSFNVYAGKVKRAPKWIQDIKMEMIYRYIFNKVSIKRIYCDFKFFLMLVFNRL